MIGMSEVDICYMSASELAKRYRNRSLSPVEVVKALIARSERINSKLNAFTYTFYEEALNRAKISEKKGQIGEVLSENLEVGCADLSIKVLEIQREGKQSQKIGQFMLGSKIKKGSNLQNE